MAEAADRTSAGVDDAVDRVIRSFTDAEVALRELVASGESFKSATATMESGRSELAASREALESTAEGLALLMASVTSCAMQLQETATALRAVDQERIWAAFESTDTALAAHDQSARESTGQLDARLVAGLAAMSVQVSTVRTDLDTAIERARSATKTEIDTATAALEAQVHSVVEASTATLGDRIASSEGASIRAISAAQAEWREGQAKLAEELGATLSRIERRTTQVLAAAVVAAVLGLVGIVLALL